ncbi:protein of unknown function [Candidatus Methylomirabilis oxygeniifera]|uniref:Uncharacterized protein n=1 Tax=Methylomirabilis oxygeniifera TaxID=671143 RepID=D5MHZ1_METO1|nr:protein of unknown function [Candidatus Methylomirabilis oxyfera]
MGDPLRAAVEHVSDGRTVEAGRETVTQTVTGNPLALNRVELLEEMT